MGNLLYLVAVILIIAWAIGFVGYSAGGLIHILLVIAVIMFLLRIIQVKKLCKKELKYIEILRFLEVNLSYN